MSWEAYIRDSAADKRLSNLKEELDSNDSNTSLQKINDERAELNKQHSELIAALKQNLSRIKELDDIFFEYHYYLVTPADALK